MAIRFKKNKGAIVLTAIIIMSAVALVLTMSVATFSLNDTVIRMNKSASLELDLAINGCYEEALIEFKKDTSGYTGGLKTIGDIECTIQVTGSGIVTINIIAQHSLNLTQEIESQVDLLTDFEVISYLEVTTT